LVSILYILGGWALLNLLFAVGMYFRPQQRESGQDLPEPGQAGEPARVPRPALMARLMLFGLWLGDRRHSA
jgi:hypothetical protein